MRLDTFKNIEIHNEKEAKYRFYYKQLPTFLSFIFLSHIL